MTRGRLGAIGVDIGTRSVKLAQVVRAPGGVGLYRAAVIPRFAPWNSSDRLAWDQPLSSGMEIRAAIDGGRFHGNDAVGALPMNVCQLRGLNIPPGTDVERRTMIADELTEEWAEQGSAMEFDFWELESGAPDKGADRNTVEVLAATRLWVSQIVRDCQRAGLACWALGGVPLAMARAVSLAGGLGGGRRVLAIDWGYSNTTICVVGEERPLYARRIHDCGFGLVVERIVRELGVTMDEAQFLVDAEGLCLRDDAESADAEIQRAVAEAAEPVLDSLIREIGRTLQFVEMQRRHLQPAAAWLMGGGATMRNVGEYLGERLDFPVETWNVAPASDTIPFAEGRRAALFAGAAALSAAGWSDA